MKGDPEFIILRHAAWMSIEFEKSILGAIIRNPLSPSTDHVPESPLQHNKYDLQESTATDFALANTGTAASEVSGEITTIAKFAVKGKTEDKSKLQGKVVRVKRLQQVSQFWTSLRSDPAVKTTVPSWISFYNTWPVCMVVGIMICEDVEYNHDTGTSAQLQATGKLPASAIAAAAGAPPNHLSDAVDPKLILDNSRESSTSFKGKFGSSQIFAVELRKVTTKLFNWKELQLHSDGPGNIDPTRLAGYEPNEDEEADLDKPVDADDMIFVNIDSEDLEDMARG
ncbi:hypothetical protein EDB81DRAFT_791620 [Dactylonectria macrodidyma]|uniref:Uncharacterized protein n=1 Tax=Dactylonectria macrodidyma TaxID=307937 RepID=A0A9P9F6A2_9HYPO|nr:hypothetical protein EDB81DRAFT_791620 [Dactylonectria macrodidyma]